MANAYEDIEVAHVDLTKDTYEDVVPKTPTNTYENMEVNNNGPNATTGLVGMEPEWSKIRDYCVLEVETMDFLGKYHVCPKLELLVTYPKKLFNFEMRKKFGEGCIESEETLPNAMWLRDDETEDLMPMYLGNEVFARWVKMCINPACRHMRLIEPKRLSVVVNSETALCAECRCNTMQLAATNEEEIEFVPMFRFAFGYRERCACGGKWGCAEHKRK